MSAILFLARFAICDACVESATMFLLLTWTSGWRHRISTYSRGAVATKVERQGCLLDGDPSKHV